MGWVHSSIKVRDSSHFLKDNANSKALSLQDENACFQNYINLFVGEAHTSAGGVGVEVRGQFTGINSHSSFMWVPEVRFSFSVLAANALPAMPSHQPPN